MTENTNSQSNHIAGTHIRRRSLPLWSFKKILNATTADIDSRYAVHVEMIRRMFDTLDIYTVSRLRLQENDSRWIITALQATERNITTWIIEQDIQSLRDRIIALEKEIELRKSVTLQNQQKALSKRLKRSIDRMSVMLGIYRRMCLYLLEGSGFLRQCFTAQERTVLQEWLSNRAENANHFIRALELVETDQHEQYIDTLLENMKNSGYLYHPHKQFQVMMTIFKISPQLVNQKMGSIFDVIQDYDRGNWMNEPFRSAFVETLQMFIEDTRELVDELPGLDNKDNNDTYSKLVQALTTQLMLSDPQHATARMHNLSMLYRYLMLQPGVNRENLLEKALASVCMFPQSTLDYQWSETNQITILGHKLSSDKPVFPATFTPLRYATQRAEVVIAPDGIVVEPLNSRQMASPVLPGGTLTWHNMQVCLFDTIDTPNHKQLRKTAALRRMWDSIDDALFSETDKSIPAIGLRKVEPEPGDVVHVIIDDTDSKVLNVLHCTIVDDEFTGEGWLHTRDIVQWYKDDPDLNFFKDPETHQYLLYEATVTTRNANGDLQLRMAQHVGQFIYDSVHTGDEFIAVVANRNERGQYTLLCENGFSIWGTADNFDHEISNRSFVRVRVTQVNSGTSIYGEIVRLATDLESFPPHAPFRNLMQDFALPDNPVSAGAQTAAPVTYDEMPPEMMHELILLMRRAAQVLPDDYVGTFNYLCMARLLARIANRQDQVDIISLHLNLLDLLAGYEQNDTVDLSKLEQHEAEAQANPTLRRLYNMLWIVGGIDNPAATPKIWDMIPTAGATETAMARMVLSMNMLGEDIVKEQRTAIKNRLMTLLRVNDRSSEQAKYYGSESLYVEFKTSIIFPPDNGMRRDIELQTRNIMRVVCGFLNANGGTLYLGVRDNGVASGLDQDMAYFHTRDKFDLHVRNSVHDLLGTTANNFVEGSWDENPNHDVYKLTIRPCTHLITLDGAVYVRQGTSTREITGEDLENYKEDRRQLFDQQKSAVEPVTVVETPEPPANSAPASSSPVTAEMHLIATSKIRPNALHDYDSDFVDDIIGYIYFRPANKYMYSPTDIYEDATSELTLAIHEDEADGYIVLVYQKKNGNRNQLTALRVAMHEITEKNAKSYYNYGAGARPVFACPVHPDDALLMIFRDGQNNYVYRAERVANLDEDKINSRGSSLFDADFSELITCEIIPAALLPRFKNGLDLPSRQVGYSVRPGTGTVEAAIQRTLDMVKP